MAWQRGVKLCVWTVMIYITSRWQLISVYRVHNSTVSKQLRYSLTRESVHQPGLVGWSPLRCGRIEFGMKSSLIYGKIKKIPQIDKLNGALINVRTRATKNKKQSKNKLIGMLEELFSKSEFIEKRRYLKKIMDLKWAWNSKGGWARCVMWVITGKRLQQKRVRNKLSPLSRTFWISVVPIF